MPVTRTDAPLIPDCSPAHVHALRVRLPTGTSVPQMSALLEEATRVWWPQEDPSQLPRLQIEQVPAEDASQAAGRRLRAELHRTIGPDGPLLRAVLLNYVNGPLDLVLVAHRAQLDTASLQLVADVPLNRLPADAVRAEQAHWPLEEKTPDEWAAADYHSRAQWAEGDPSGGDRTATVEVPVSGKRIDTAVLAVAAAMVLGRYEGQQMPVIAMLAQLPERPDRALGAYEGITLLPLDFAGDRTVGELVKQARNSLDRPQHWCEHQRYANLAPAAGSGPLVGVIAPAGRTDTEEPGTSAVVCQTAPFAVTLTPGQSAEGTPTLMLHHRLAEVDAESAGRFARHVVRAYAQINVPRTVAQPQVPLDIDLLDSAERAQQVALGEPGSSLHWQPQRIDEVFAARAAEQPDAIALTCEGQSMTYSELDILARRLAAGLLACGVQPGDRVGICLDRSLDLVATMLAVLRADAVYVPMDPAHPVDRLAYTADDAQLRLIVTHLDAFPGDRPVRKVRPNDLIVYETAGASVLPNRLRDPGMAAYIIYTSGSTGRPKGVAVPHRNVVALLAATREDFGLGPDDTWTLFHSAAFDFSVWEIWGPLLTGGRIVVVPYWVSRSPEEFHDLLANEHVSVLNQTPSAFAQLMEADLRKKEPLPLRLVVFGGEPLNTRMLRAWFDRYPESDCRLVNMFGITETTVHVTAKTVTLKDAIAGSVSVGRALPGWYIYVLDERGRPVPCGTPGEIYVGGEGVALGYLGRPDLTAHRFLTDPFKDGRMYRSGDRGRIRLDGQLEHLGRLDTQVKVRGFRIELDEIRNVLLDDPAVTDAAVVLGGETSSDAAKARIDAFVVLRSHDTASVRRRASKFLPEYMLPATINELPALPLTANGKLDTRRLTVPPAVLDLAHEDPPKSSMEAALSEIWCEILGVERIGRESDFFEQGGQSLMAARMVARIRSSLQVKLPISAIFKNPTISLISELIETVIREGSAASFR